MMKKNKIIVAAILLCCFPAAQAEDARSVMEKVFDRDDGDSSYSHEVIATCKYRFQDKNVRCVEKPRVKRFEAVRKDYGEEGDDQKSVMIIHKPAIESGIGFLQYDWDDQARDSDQWMYLSALGKVKRIVSGNDNEPKKGSLFGSEFSYEDIEKRHVDDYVYKLLREEVYKGNDSWVIESLPTPEHARKSNYGRSVQWIDKSRYLIHKIDLFDRGGKRVKQLVFSNYQLHDDVWLAQKLNMNNLRDRRISTMKTEEVTVNIAVDDALLTQRTLTDGAFREKHLNTLRKRAK